MTHQLSRRQFLATGLAGLVSSGLLPKHIHAHVVQAQDGRKRIYIAIDDHTDYLWTADEETYRQAFLEMLDYYLDLTEATQAEPAEHQSRWNCDGSFWLWTYEKNKTPQEFERLIEQIRSGHVSVPLNALPICLGGAPAEAVIRGMYYSGHIERRYDLRFPLVYSMENQTLPYGLVSLWAGSGGRYSWKGICDCATKVPFAGDREHDIYWWEGPDSSRLLMKWNSFYGNDSMGGYAEARDPAGVIELVDNNGDFQSRYPYDVIGAFGKGWDDLKTLTDEFVTVAKEKTNDNRLVIVSNESDFFEDFETTYGADIPTMSVGYGNEWELYCASLAEVSASVKRSVEKLRSAEAMAALVSLQDAAFMDGRSEARDLAWMNLGLYWDHDWTADGPVPRETRGNWQRRLATEIAAYVDTLHADATSALGGLVQAPDDNPAFFVFNPLGWPRSDYADLPYDGAEDVQVIDATSGSAVPCQFVTIDGARTLRILAHDVPAAGYKVYTIQPGAGEAFPDAAAANGSTLENDRYSVTFNERGAIASLTDTVRGEFVREINGGLLNDLGDGSASFTVENQGPVSVTLRADVSGTIARTIRVTLYSDIDRIDIHNTINQNFSDVLAWRFGFALDNPRAYHEEVGALVWAELDSNGGQYASRNARYDWLTLNHFVAMQGADRGITLSNRDCYYMQLGNSTADYLDTSTPQVSVLAGGQVDGDGLGIQNQGGDSQFVQRFALRPHDSFAPADSMRFALEHGNPLVAGPISGGSAYPETSRAFVDITDPNVLLWALKPAEDGIDTGLIVRVWNVGHEAATLSLGLPGRTISAAQETTHLETPLASVDVVDNRIEQPLNRQQLKTFLLQTSAE
ncbi:MAG: glycoside hydrolase [Anaerolineaceae bacterium]|nr:glycoside hydrolase [Anaerolineaceae bacterium]